MTRTGSAAVRGSLSIGLVVLAWGVQAMVTQSLLLREALVLMSGSEIVFGLVLFAWLLGIALGATAGGRVAVCVRRPGGWLAGDLVLLAAGSCAAIWMLAGARSWLGVSPGELLSPAKAAAAALLLIGPVGILIGAAFPLACAVPVKARTGSDVDASGQTASLGTIYAIESAGSLLGGAAFSFWAVEHLSPLQTAVACSGLTLLACAAMLRRARWWLTLLGAAAVIVAMAGGDRLERVLQERRWRSVAPNYELVAAGESRYQSLALGRRAEQFTLFCDGQAGGDFPDPYTSVPLAHFWMCQHPAPRSVLVIGGSTEGLLPEILRHPVEHVDQVELDARQIELVEQYLPESDRPARHDPRVTVHAGDARLFIKRQRDRYDLVIARLPEPTSALRARLYTVDFYRELREAMTSRAVLCLTATATPARLTPLAAEYLASIRAGLRSVFPVVVVGWGDPAQVLAGTTDGLLATAPGELARRYEARGVQSAAFSPLWFEGIDWLEPAKVAERASELDAARPEISTDLRPIICVQRLQLWERMTAGSSGGLIERLRAVRWPQVFGGLLGMLPLLALGLYAFRRIRNPSDGSAWAWSAVVTSLGSTGFVSMAMSLIWLFAFQNLYGYVYGRIGWLIALFMTGLVIGSLAARTCRRERRGLIRVDVAMALLAMTPLSLPLLARLQASAAGPASVEVLLSALMAMTGVLCGAAFALGGQMQAKHAGNAAAAGVIVGADHAGACLGALLTGVLLAPVLGIAMTAVLLAGLKTVSALMLWRARSAE